jgi:hypothetical protein
MGTVAADILASLDLGRRQAELEGFELVQEQVELAMILYDAHDRWVSLLTKQSPRCPTSAPSKVKLHRRPRSWCVRLMRECWL